MFEILMNASISAVITTLSLVIGYYVLSKKAEKLIETNKIQLKIEAENWLNSEKGQKALYSIGALIGNGARTGIGLQTKTGKFKFQDLLGQIAGNYIQNKIIPNISQNSSLNNPIKERLKSTSKSLKIE